MTHRPTYVSYNHMADIDFRPVRGLNNENVKIQRGGIDAECGKIYLAPVDLDGTSVSCQSMSDISNIL